MNYKFQYTFAVTVLLLVMFSGCVSEFTSWEESYNTMKVWNESEFLYLESEKTCDGDDCGVYVCQPIDSNTVTDLLETPWLFGSLFSGGGLSESSCGFIQMEDVYDEKSLDEQLEKTYDCTGIWDCLSADEPQRKDVRQFMLGSGFTFVESNFLNAGQEIPTIDKWIVGGGYHMASSCFVRPNSDTLWPGINSVDRVCDAEAVYRMMNDSGYTNECCNVTGFTPITTSTIATQYLPVASDGILLSKPSETIATKYLESGIIPVYVIPYDWWPSATREQKNIHANLLVDSINVMNTEYTSHSSSIGPVMIVIGSGIEFNDVYPEYDVDKMDDAYCYLRSLSVRLKKACPSCIISVNLPLQTVNYTSSGANTTYLDRAMKILAPKDYGGPDATLQEVEDICEPYNYLDISTKCAPNHIESPYDDLYRTDNCVDAFTTTVSYNLDYGSNSANCNPTIQMLNALEIGDKALYDYQKLVLLIDAMGYSEDDGCQYTDQDILTANEMWVGNIGYMSLNGFMGMIIPSMSPDPEIFSNSEDYSIYNPYYSLNIEQGLFNSNGDVFEDTKPLIKGYKIYYTGKNAQSGLIFPAESGAYSCKFAYNSLVAYIKSGDVVDWDYDISSWTFDIDGWEASEMNGISLNPSAQNINKAKHSCDGTSYKMKDLTLSSINRNSWDFDDIDTTSFDLWSFYQSAGIYGLDPWLVWAVYMQEEGSTSCNSDDITSCFEHMSQWLEGHPDTYLKLADASYKSYDKLVLPFGSGDYLYEPYFEMDDEGNYENKEDFEWTEKYLTFCEYYNENCAEDVMDAYFSSTACPCAEDNGIIPFILESGVCSPSVSSKIHDSKVKKAFSWYVKASKDVDID